MHLINMKEVFKNDISEINLKKEALKLYRDFVFSSVCIPYFNILRCKNFFCLTVSKDFKVRV